VVHRIFLAVLAAFAVLAGQASADVFDDNPTAATVNGTVYVFARNADGRIIERHAANGTWSAWAPIDGLEAGSGPAAVAFGSSLLLFARGQDGALWWNQLANGIWFGWRSLEGQLTSAPSAGVRVGTVTVDVAARGLDNGLYHRMMVAGQGWQPWERLADNIASAPTVVGFYSTGSIDIFYRGSAGNLIQFYFDSGKWNGPFDSGGVSIGAPASASASVNRLDLYVRGSDNALYYHEHPDGPAKGWTRVDPTTLQSSPAATSDRPGHELVFARIGDQLQMRQVSVPAAGKGNPSFGPWIGLGAIGLPSDPPPPQPTPQPAPPAPQPQPPQAQPPAATLVTLAPTVSYFGRYARRTARLTTLNVTGVPAGATVKVTCRKGCSAKTYTVTKKKAGTVSLKRFIKRPIKVGTKITVVTTKPGTIGSHKVLTIRARRRPSVTVRCLPPGATRPQDC
jgi:hypothetical protein